MNRDALKTRSYGGVVSAAVVFLGCPLGCQTQMAPSNGTGDETVSFSTEIQPILTPNCSGCHRPGGIADMAGIALQLTEGVAYDLLVNQPSVQDGSLTLVVPGDSASSLLFLKVSSDAPPVGDRMPLSSPALSAGEIMLIRDWIDQGALDN